MAIDNFRGLLLQAYNLIDQDTKTVNASMCGCQNCQYAVEVVAQIEEEESSPRNTVCDGDGV